VERSKFKRLGIDTGMAGAYCELAVCGDLLLRGYQVFRSISPSSPYDLIAVSRDGLILRIEVKHAYRNPRTDKLHCSKRNRGDVLAMVVSDEGAIVYDPELPDS